MSPVSKPESKLALVVHPELGVLSKFQETFRQGGMTTLMARDLPTALIAISQNDFEVAVISWRVAEPGDGWALGWALRRIFPGALVVVLANETSVPTLKDAINYGFDHLFDASHSPEEVAAQVVLTYSKRLSAKVQEHFNLAAAAARSVSAPSSLLILTRAGARWYRSFCQWLH